MKLIPLTQGFFALVDDEDYNFLMQWKWYAFKNGNTYYAVRFIKVNNKQKKIMMHRVIMNTSIDQEVDHQDHDGLNCQRYNMRNCTHQQNGMNGGMHGIVPYLGVYIKRKKFAAKIGYNNKGINLGTFSTMEEAARAYDKKAKELFGEFANLNFKEKEYAS